MSNSYFESDAFMATICHDRDADIAAELRGEKPHGTAPNWRQYWRGTYVNLRANIARTGPSSIDAKLIAYIHQQRRKAGLPLYDDGGAEHFQRSRKGRRASRQASFVTESVSSEPTAL